MKASKPDPTAKLPTYSAQRFQQLKADVHRQLVEMLDISRVDQVKSDRVRREVRTLATQLAGSSPELLNEVERERLIEEIMNEAFGLGPLEAFMNDPTVSDILVNGPGIVYIEPPRPAPAHLRRLRGQRPPHSDHSAHHRSRRPPRR